jgi:hypothetical protein
MPPGIMEGRPSCRPTKKLGATTSLSSHSFDGRDGTVPPLLYIGGLSGSGLFLIGTSSCGATSYSGLGVPINQ